MNMVNLNMILKYLHQKAWTQVESPTSRLFVFQGPKDDQGKTIELILPSSLDFNDSQRRIDTAIALLAAVENQSNRQIINQILEMEKPRSRSELGSTTKKRQRDKKMFLIGAYDLVSPQWFETRIKPPLKAKRGKIKRRRRSKRKKYSSSISVTMFASKWCVSRLKVLGDIWKRFF